MKQYIFHIVLLACFLPFSLKSEVTFQGNLKPVFAETPAASSGLSKVYVLMNTADVSVSYTASGNTSTVKWYTFGATGAAYAEEITSGIEVNNNVSTLTRIAPDKGYVVEEGTKREYFWIVDYSAHYLNLDKIVLPDESDCDRMILGLVGEGGGLSYYSINGRRINLDRDLVITYNTMEWDADERNFKETRVELKESELKNAYTVATPYCNTVFTLSGDRFLDFWGLNETIESDYYNTKAVQVQSIAERVESGEEGTSSELGGSAPVTVQFSGYVTDAVVFKEWQIAKDMDFEEIRYRFSEQNVEYTFNEAGTFYVRFVGANDNGSCESMGETYEISIGESYLRCPNTFTPNSSPGVNDEWKVASQSLVEFQCTIFNRWGMKICQFANPDQGWDGKYKGKYVQPGVYFYVIKARGADGKKYNMSGDINIIKKKDI